MVKRRNGLGKNCCVCCEGVNWEEVEALPTTGGVLPRGVGNYMLW